MTDTRKPHDYNSTVFRVEFKNPGQKRYFEITKFGTLVECLAFSSNHDWDDISNIALETLNGLEFEIMANQ